MRRAIRFTVNGRPTELEAEPSRRLLWVLRTELGLTGTKYGCGQGFCGSCTVLVDGQATRSCLLPVSRVEGADVLTIEGLADGADLHPVQQAFLDHDAYQCGYCTPGMILGAVALLKSNGDPTEEEVRSGLEGHLCRCGTHVRVLKAVRTAAAAMEGGAS